MPEFPYYQVARFAPQHYGRKYYTLLCLIVPQCAAAIEKLFEEAKL
jgi:hypothetical protein